MERGEGSRLSYVHTRSAVVGVTHYVLKLFDSPQKLRSTTTFYNEAISQQHKVLKMYSLVFKCQIKFEFELVDAVLTFLWTGHALH